MLTALVFLVELVKYLIGIEYLLNTPQKLYLLVA